MKFLWNPVAKPYRDWMDRWENELCFRATDRVKRPFEYGLDWSAEWPITQGFAPNGEGPVSYLAEVNRRVVSASHEFFGYEKPADFRLEGEWLAFRSPVRTPYQRNNVVRALWFPAPGSRKAVVVLPHWNAKLPQHNALCRGLQRLGISALRLSLPYHDLRMPADLSRADFAVSSNVCRTIAAARQAVIDTRCAVDWLEQEGYADLGVIGTSLGSCYAFLASAHDARIRVNVFNHCSTYFADVVWEGLSTRHIRESLEGAVNLETLRKLWVCISPPSYWELYAGMQKRAKFIYARYDTTFPVHLSQDVVAGARKHRWDHEVAVLPCGHYTMGEFPFKYIAGYQICAFVKRNL
jgi:hypothetical protein